ncbi:flagellar protein FlgN [Tuberibacillus sp. Marseille-P3662]|uniref:flagellar protein FlgN n=1 Tax=Tuberibacillus sp. Marseille-P3662 TaxID=1965358 RepID=UPI000A1CDA59|nr:flagellar protein FlgN [Tuberibacillus sp. Marseille-P3662]
MMNDLVSTLDDLLQAHERLLALAQKKSDTIKEGDFATLDQVMNQEQSMIQAITQLEERRLNMTETFFREKGVHNDGTLTMLIAHAPEVTGRRLQDTQLQLANVLYELQAVNQFNQELLSQSLEWVHLNMNLAQPKTEPTNYEPPSKQKLNTPATSRFDSRA